MRKSQFVAQGGMLTAASLVLLLLAAVLPAGQVGVCAAAGVIPAAPLSHSRIRLGTSIYAATLLIGWLILPRKSLMAVYTVLGLYTLAKYVIERWRKPVLEWVCKLIYCNLTAALVAAALGAGLLPAVRIKAAFHVAALIVLFNLVFAVYDVAFSQLIGLMRRIFPKE